MTAIMPMRLSPFVFAFALFLAGCAPSQEVVDTTPSDEAPEEAPSIRISEFDLDDIEYPELREFELPDIERVTLDNGMTIFLVEDAELPLVNARARINTGDVHEPAEKVGLASITGSVMRSGGTESMTPDELNDMLEAIGASVETSIGQTSGSASMSTLDENAYEVLSVFADVLRRPAFDQEEVNLAKSQQRSAISRRNDNPQQIAFREFSKLIHGEDSPYARTTEYYTIDEIERDDLIDFHERYVHPENIILSVWGDIDREDMISQLEQAFADWERPATAEVPSAPQPEMSSDAGVHFIEKDDVTQSTILMGHGGEITMDDPDYFPVIVMNEVLSGGFSGRLFREVRSAQGLAYSVFGNYGAGYDRPGQFSAGVFTRSDATIEAARSVMSEIERMQEEPPSDEELQLAKDSYLNSFVFNFANKSQILGRMMTYEHYGYPEDFLDQINEGVQNVTASDVHRVSQQYLNPDQLDILILGRQSDFDEPVTALADDGEVNEIDISIPTSPPSDLADAPEATEEDLAAGQERLMAVRDALGGAAFNNVESFQQSTETTVSSPQGEQTLSGKMLISFDPERIRSEITLPNGMSITLADDGDQLMMQAPQGTAPAPPQLRGQMRSELQRSLLYMMVHAEDAQVQNRGEQELDGETYQALDIRFDGDNFTLFVDAETDIPAALEYQGTDPQTNAPINALARFSEFEAYEGLRLPTTITSYQDGEEASETRITELELNVDPDDDLFELE